MSELLNISSLETLFFTISLKMYHRTNVWCFKKRSLQKKKYSNSKVREENITVVYCSAMIAATWKVHFSCALLLPSSWWCRRCGWELAVWHTLDRLVVADWGRTGRDIRTFNSPVLTSAFNSPKSRYLFSYIEILENKSKTLECSMSPVKHVIIHLWLF